jgi:hypothetical protein
VLDVLKLTVVFFYRYVKQILLEVARTKNNSPLPLIKPHCGLRLPPDRYCLSSCNYKLRSNKKVCSCNSVCCSVFAGVICGKYKFLLPVAGLRCVALMLHIHGSWIQITATWLAILMEVIHGFSQPVQKNTTIVLEIRTWLRPVYYWPVIIWHSIIWDI